LDWLNYHGVQVGGIGSSQQKHQCFPVFSASTKINHKVIRPILNQEYTTDFCLAGRTFGKHRAPVLKYFFVDFYLVSSFAIFFSVSEQISG
jgi:hypothetical protein